MSQEIEIEFKNLLTKQEYDQLLTLFSISPNAAKRQINHYFDTPEAHLKSLSSGLRIRIFPEEIECTLKEKTSTNSHLETTDALTREQADAMINDGIITAPTVTERLLSLNVPITELALFGTLTTDRIELPYKGGTLVLDHSFYLHCEDYEVEYETTDERFGEQVFLQLLKTCNIQQCETPKKIARFMQAYEQKG